MGVKIKNYCTSLNDGSYKGSLCIISEEVMQGMHIDLLNKTKETRQSCAFK